MVNKKRKNMMSDMFASAIKEKVARVAVSATISPSNVLAYPPAISWWRIRASLLWHTHSLVVLTEKMCGHGMTASCSHLGPCHTPLPNHQLRSNTVAILTTSFYPCEMDDKYFPALDCLLNPLWGLTDLDGGGTYSSPHYIRVERQEMTWDLPVLRGPISAVFLSSKACPWQVMGDIIPIEGETGFLAGVRSLLPLVKNL